jgi:glyoxylase-like metal-dependent hydrolase (beta-lactamase superfamily II)
MTPPLTDSKVTPVVVPFFDAATNTISYIVRDPDSLSCAIIDPVLDFDPASGRTSTANADLMITHIKTEGWSLEWLIETHVHADHLSSGRYIQSQLGGKIGIGRAITKVQAVFGEVFAEDVRFARDGSQFDVLFDDLDLYHIGTMQAVALHTPGHTPACMTHVIGDTAFVGDTLFMPDQGSARADFQVISGWPVREEGGESVCTDYAAPAALGCLPVDIACPAVISEATQDLTGDCYVFGGCLPGGFTGGCSPAADMSECPPAP